MFSAGRRFQQKAGASYHELEPLRASLAAFAPAITAGRPKMPANGRLIWILAKMTDCAGRFSRGPKPRASNTNWAPLMNSVWTAWKRLGEVCAGGGAGGEGDGEGGGDGCGSKAPSDGVG